MAAPTIVPCPVGVWTKVATAVSTARVHFLLSTPRRYLHTYRLTGVAAPVGLTDAVLGATVDPEGEIPNILHEHGELVDIYVYADGGAGSVRVDTPMSYDGTASGSLTAIAASTATTATNTTVIDALEETLVNAASIVAGAYPATVYYPSADGRVLGARQDVSIDMSLTGVAGRTAAFVVETQDIAGGTWKDITLSGMNARWGSPSPASYLATGAVTVVGTWRWSNCNAYAIRLRVNLTVGASGAALATLRRKMVSR